MSRVWCVYIKEDGHGVDMSRIRCIYIKEDGHGVDMGGEEWGSIRRGASGASPMAEFDFCGMS